MSFVFVFVHKKHSSSLLRKLNSSLKFTMLEACGCYWHYSKAVTVILADSRLVEVPRRIMLKRKWWNRTNKFFTLVMVFKNRVHFGDSWNENVYLCTYAKCFFFFFFFVAEASPSVQFVTASLGNVIMEKKKKLQKCVTISPEDARSKTNCHCVVFNSSTWTLFECFFYFWGTSTKKVNNTVCHCCTVSVEIWILCLVL